MCRTSVFTVGRPSRSCCRARSLTGQEACALSERHSLGSVGGPEFLVDVFDVRFHGGTADAELAADRGERSIGREEDQDAALGRRHGNRAAGLFIVGRVRLTSDSAVTLRRERSIVIGQNG
jgi:hypothetical protein